MFGKMMNSFYYGKSGKGDFRKEDLPKNRWQLFWEMLRVRFSALCRLNLMTLAAWLPLIIVIGMCVSTLLNVMSITGDYSNYVQTGDAGNLSAEQIAALKQKLAETDYIAAKTVDLLIGAESLSALLTVLAETRSEYREILDLRSVWRQKIRELEAAESKQNKEV